jgi:DNA-directed RNA polymerase subunit E"
MSKKKVCKRCKMFVEASECPNCKTSQFSNNWQGRMAIIDPVRSNIAKKIGITSKGEYAIKVR